MRAAAAMPTAMSGPRLTSLRLARTACASGRPLLFTKGSRQPPGIRGGSAGFSVGGRALGRPLIAVPILRRYVRLSGALRAPEGKSMQTFRDTGEQGLISRIAALQDKSSFKELHWEGSLEEYLRLIRENPRITRTAFQRMYDMILSHGKTEYIDNKKRLIRYHFFHDEPNGGRDAVYGLDVPLMKLVNVFKSAAAGYGTEKRVILLHGPVGSSKSTIVRLLKKGLEEYSRTPEGALYTFSWVLEKKRDDGSVHQERFPTPMNEDPLLLIPEEWREKVFADLCPPDSGFQIPVRGDLCPASRLIFRELMTEYKGDFAKVMSHVRVRRLLLSEKDGIGIGTFQP